MRAIVASSFLCACGVPDPLVKEQGPKAAARAWNLAVERGDFGALYGLTRPLDRSTLTGCMLLLCSKDAAPTELDALLSRHGLGELPDLTFPPMPAGPDLDVIAKYLDPVRDPRALYVDALAFLLQRSGGKVQSGEPTQWNIRGDSAHTRFGGAPARFERIDGHWYMVQDVNATSSEMDVKDE